MAASGTIARRSGVPIVSSCFGSGASLLLAAEPDDQLTTREKHRRAAIPRSERDKEPRVFLRRDERGDYRRPGEGRGVACRCPHLVVFIQREKHRREPGWEKAQRRKRARGK